MKPKANKKNDKKPIGQIPTTMEQLIEKWEEWEACNNGYKKRKYLGD